ncbi:helix-turn-helix transcriptional regulator [Streptomonospora sp. S1-112]|uniref:Helix-turn-helix transcriptional regulator n=1 Tax=Streptomonospora mangrovi TaxID=2883123 RepID=A0A9X3NJV0_9ACTN|nr:helix-turn-helix transcriptional regulator [Streptomonospora mangrovi]MDA0563401.1 helix-turn-helix transcriptional regulator [Streptomonospora mangrovi]
MGALLRQWRERRRISQLDLSIAADISARHLSFVETGRSRPSRQMVLRLSACMEVPLRERNHLLLAAGYAPVYSAQPLEGRPMAPVREALGVILKGHEPSPAVVVDRAWTLLEANASVAVLLEGVDPELLEPPVNVLRLSLHPRGLAPNIANLGEWRAHLLHRLHRQIDHTADEDLRALHRELSDYPGTEDEPDPEALPAGEVALPLRLRARGGELRFLSTVATFGTPLDVTVSELVIESFFPADEATAAALRAFAAGLAPATGG